MEQINQLEMQIADAESLKMRENESLQNNDQNTNDIEKLIEKAPVIKTVKDGSKFISNMRLSVKYYVMQQKMKEKMAQEINMAFQ